MKFGAVPVDKAVGSLLAHAAVDEQGHVLLGKGQVVSPTDRDRLLDAGIHVVMAASLEQGDVAEDASARIVGDAIAAPGLAFTTPGAGRALITASAAGIFEVDPNRLLQLNSLDAGITLATLPNHTIVQQDQLVALVKIIPYSIPERVLQRFSALAGQQGPCFALHPFQPRIVALIVAAPQQQQEKLAAAYVHPTRERIERWHGTLGYAHTVDYTTTAICSALAVACNQHVDLILVAGVAAIMDLADTIPQALLTCGGTIIHFGMPVDPGSLLLFGELRGTPVVGMPSCARSRKPNVVDLIIPRLLVGERLEPHDLLELGHGGLLDEIRERPWPRMV